MTQVDLAEEVKRLKLENEQLKLKLSQKKSEEKTENESSISDFSLDEYKRYGRQMVVPQVTIEGQKKLKRSRVLVIGAGGLGCPALLYLAGAGVGKIGIVDDDTVDTSNLHRQVLHTTDKVGEYKCESAKSYLNKLNPHVEIQTYPFRLSTCNAFEIFEQYDLVLDCTDSPYSRYLISDVAVITGIPVVSGSGLKTEGQLSILNFQNTGPCYRCFYPKPPPPNSVTSCKDGGVVGPVIGLMGVMMALETIKVIVGTYTRENFKPFLSIYSGYDQQSIKTFKMRGRKADCLACSGKITKEIISRGDINYAEFCGVVNYNVLKPEERITIEEYAKVVSSDHVLIDVRPIEHFDIIHLPNSVNIPLDRLKRIDNKDELGFDTDKPVYTVCRYGNDSQYASRYLNDTFGLKTKDVSGGLFQWSKKVDPKFPTY